MEVFKVVYGVEKAKKCLFLFLLTKEVADIE